MAFYIKDKRQANYEQNLKRASDMLSDRENSMPMFRGAKILVAVIGFAIGAVMIIMGYMMGITPAVEGEVSAGAIAFVSGMFSCVGALIALISLRTYQAGPLIISCLVFFLALILAVVHPDGTTLMRGICLPEGAAGLIAGFYAKTSFEAMKQKGLQYKKNLK